MVGLHCGFTSKHKKATSMMDFSLFSTSSEGGGIRPSNTSLSPMFVLPADEVEIEERKSFG